MAEVDLTSLVVPILKMQQNDRVFRNRTFQTWWRTAFWEPGQAGAARADGQILHESVCMFICNPELSFHKHLWTNINTRSEHFWSKQKKKDYLQYWSQVNQLLTFASAQLLFLNSRSRATKHLRTVAHVVKSKSRCYSCGDTHANSYILDVDSCVVEFSVTVEPAVVEQHTNHSLVWQVVLALSGARREVQVSCRREDSVYMQVNFVKWWTNTLANSRLFIHPSDSESSFIVHV